MLSVNASPSIDVSVNFGSISSRSLQRKDVAAGAKGVPHRCVTNGRASSRAPDRCDKHGAARHRVAKDGAVKVHARRRAQQGANIFPTTTSFNSRMNLLRFDNLDLHDYAGKPHSAKNLPKCRQLREDREGLRLRTASPPTGPAACSPSRCLQRPHTHKH